MPKLLPRTMKSSYPSNLIAFDSIHDPAAERSRKLDLSAAGSYVISLCSITYT